MTKADDILICLPVESKSREFDSRLYLALCFAARGYPVLFGSKGGVHKAMYEAGTPFVYFSKGLNHQYLPLLRDIHLKGGVVVNLDEENYSAVNHDGRDFMVKGRNLGELMRFVDLSFTWTEGLRGKILKYIQECEADEVVVAGNARFDLRKPRYRALYLTEIASRDGVADGYILFNTSFGAGNHVLGLKGYLDKARFNYRHLYDEEALMARHEYLKGQVAAFVSAASRLALAFPERQVVIRPHPSEDTSPYEECAGGTGNIVVTRRGIAAEWLPRASVLIHHDCTTGLEAVFHGLPTISYCPGLRLDLVKSGSVQASHMVFEEDELVATVGRVLAGEDDLAPDAERLAHIRQSVDSVDYSAAQRIVDTVEDRLDAMFERACRVGEDSGPTMRTVPNPDHKADEDTKRKYEQYRRNKFEGLGRKEVDDFLSRLHQVDPSLPRVEVEDKGGEAYWIVRTGRDTLRR